MKKLNQLQEHEIVTDIPGDLIQVDVEVQALNEQYGHDFDGYILTPQNGRTYISYLYGFYGAVPTNETEAYIVQTYVR